MPLVLHYSTVVTYLSYRWQCSANLAFASAFCSFYCLLRYLEYWRIRIEDGLKINDICKIQFFNTKDQS